MSGADGSKVSSPELTVSCHEKLDPETKALWKCQLANRAFGEVVLDWCEALQDTAPANVEIHYIQVFDGRQPLGIAILHIIRRLDLSKYVGGATQRAFGRLAKLGIRPLHRDVAYLEVPLVNISGVFFSDHGLSRSPEVAGEITKLVKERFRFDIFCLKGVQGAPGEDAFESLPLAETSFLGNMRLDLGYASFDEYLRSRSAKNRWKIRNNRKIFTASGGLIDTIDDIRAHAGTLGSLYGNTLARHKARGDLELPIKIGEGFFSALGSADRPGLRVFLARVGGRTAGFALTLWSGDELWFLKCGLDYEICEPSRAYINLYYAMIEYAIERGAKGMALGSEAYETKREVGAMLQPTKYYFSIENKYIRPVVDLLTRNFSSQSERGTLSRGHEKH